MKSALVRVNTNWPDVAYSNWREGYEMMKTAIEMIVGAVLVQSRILNWIFRVRSLGHDIQATASEECFPCACFPCGLCNSIDVGIKLIQML